MDVEIKKDSKKIEISKNTIIIILSVALVIVSAVAICLACFEGERGDKNENGRGRMMGQYQQYGGYVDDNNVNPNDTEVQDDQNVPITPNTVVPPKTNTGAITPPVTTPKAQ